MSDLPDQPLLILGMHRSGTSYLARLMQALGVHIGDDLVGPQKGNPRGHFEALSLLTFHQKLLAARVDESRRAFDDGMLVQAPLSVDYSADERQEARALVESLRRPGHWGWKEPRTCLFLDLWGSLLERAGAVIIYRHPLEVHQSLLRREHWDLALFPDQAYRAYTVYNQALMAQHFDPAFLFNANAGFADLEALANRLRSTFSLKDKEPLPAFHAREFHTLPISAPLHRLTALIFPEAAAAFDALQEQADLPFTWDRRGDDEALEAMASHLEPLLEGLPPEGRACLGPLLDYWAAGPQQAVFDRYASLAGEIGGRVRRVEEWNRQAAEIFKENERLAADYERMGKAFAGQQAFLAKQAATQAKVWEELTRTGNSWKEQRDLIKDLLAEKRRLLEEIRDLKSTREGGNGTAS